MSKKGFWLLLTRNLIVERRSYVQTVVEIITILAILYMLFQIKTHEIVKQQPLFHRNEILTNLSEFRKLMLIKETAIPYKLFFTPNSKQNQNIFNEIGKTLNLVESVGFNNEETMIEQFEASTVLACVILKDHNITIRFPNYFRTRPNRNFYKLQDFWLTRCTGSWAEDTDHALDFYIREGFLQLLYTIEVEKSKQLGIYETPLEISSVIQNNEPKTSCVNKLTRNPPTLKRFMTWSLYYFIYFVPFINLIWRFSRESEENIFAHHWIYGFSYNAQRLSHFIVSLFHLILLDTVILLTIIFLWPTQPAWKLTVLFIFLIVQNMLLVIYAKILSVIIQNAKTALWCSITLWIISFAVFSETLNTINFDILTPKILIITVLFFNNLFPSGIIDYFETEENKSLKEILIFLGMQCIILLFYGCLLKFVEHNWSGQYVKRLHITNNKQTCNKYCMEIKPKFNENHIEYGPISSGILQLKNVYSYCDHFKKYPPQLKNISMRFFTNEISVVLGSHNSGKTNFISVLAGWQAYKGLILYGGRNIDSDWLLYRQHVDVSMPNNSLFDLLTTAELLRYFILIKRPAAIELKSEQEKWLHIIKTTVADAQKLVKTLSFSEQRILALCCTLACNTSIVLLDEPTAHMTVEEQNKYWNILRQEKQNRIIIVTTSSVDEANEIADRIAIFNDGCLTAWGTPYFLRSKFADEFYLICFLEPDKSIQSITLLIENYIRHIKIQNHFTDRVIYVLPANKKSVFQQLLIKLEKNSYNLGITNLYITGSSLNEVYMKALSLKQNNKTQLPDAKNTLKLMEEKKSNLKPSLVQALLYKKLLLQSKNFIPIITIFIAFFIILGFNEMSPASFNVDNITFYGEKIIKDFNHALMEISNVEGIKNGFFYYKNIEYLNDTYENRSMKNYNSLAAIEVKGPSINAWFNGKTFHSAPLALNLAFNYMTNGSTYTNKPIILRHNYYIHIILGAISPLTMSIVFLNLQEEQFCNMLTLQRLPGLNNKIRWGVAFLWDFSISMLISILYLIILIVCVLVKSTCLIITATLILFLISNTASLFFIYLMFLFVMEDNKLRAFIKIYLIQLLLGILPFILYTNIMQNYEILFYAFMLLPGFAVLHGTNKIFDNNEKLNLSSYFQWNNPGIADSIFFISLTGAIYFTIFVAVIVYRRASFKSIPKKVKTFASVCYPYDDERVVKEKVRISNMNIESCKAQTILVDQLEKKLPKKGKRVSSISFAANAHTCLGIYGSNHSGKSHLLKQLVGAESYWFGEVYIAGFNCKKQMVNALKNVGYCPQSRGFNNLLTPTELLTFFLNLYGINRFKHLDHLRDLSILLQLRKYMNSRMGDLPQNIQRRVNLAVALIAGKNILILDEPTKGLPAFDRLLIWNIIKVWRSLDKTIIFATNESLELNELADVVVTVNAGEMLYYDNPHNMVYQHNIGFYLEIKLYADGLTLQEVKENLNTDLENLNRFIMFFHEESELVYRCNNVVKYYIPVENVIYSHIFGSIEKNRNRLNIADYTLPPFPLNRVLKSLQKAHKEKRRNERSRRTRVLKDPKTLPKRY